MPDRLIDEWMRQCCIFSCASNIYFWTQFSVGGNARPSFPTTWVLPFITCFFLLRNFETGLSKLKPPPPRYSVRSGPTHLYVPFTLLTFIIKCMFALITILFDEKNINLAFAFVSWTFDIRTRFRGEVEGLVGHHRGTSMVSNLQLKKKEKLSLSLKSSRRLTTPTAPTGSKWEEKIILSVEGIFIRLSSAYSTTPH